MPPRKIWRFDRAELKNRYHQLGSSRKLAKVYGCSHYTMWYTLVELEIVRRPPGGVPLNGRWSMLYDRCVVCNGTDRPHYALGMCSRDYTLWRWRRENPGRPRYVSRDFSEVLR